MKEWWKYSKLGDVATYINGFAFKPSDWVDLGMPIIRIQNLTEGGAKYNLCNRDDIPEKYRVIDGDILISWSATLGVYEWHGVDAWLNQHIFKVVFDKERINKYFFRYAIESSLNEMAKHTNGATMKHIRKGDFDNIVIPVPSLYEQQQIVTYLDAAFEKVDAIKANVEKSLSEAKALFQSALKEMMQPKEGWEEKTLGEITIKISDGSHNPPLGLEFSDYEMLSSKNVRNDHFDFENPRYLTKEDFEKEDKRTNLEKGDVLLTIVGAGLGDCCVYDYEKKIVFQRSVSVIKPSLNAIVSRFLMYTLQYNYDDIRHQSNGAAQKGIYLKQLAAYTVSFPPLSTQHSIVATLDALSAKVSALEANYTKTISECAALKQAILRDVFE